MRKYTVLEPITFQVGSVLSLSKEQVAARVHALKKSGKNWRVVKPVQFKSGETIGFDGDLPKSLCSLVEPEKNQQ